MDTMSPTPSPSANSLAQKDLTESGLNQLLDKIPDGKQSCSPESNGLPLPEQNSFQEIDLTQSGDETREKNDGQIRSPNSGNTKNNVSPEKLPSAAPLLIIPTRSDAGIPSQVATATNLPEYTYQTRLPGLALSKKYCIVNGSPSICSCYLSQQGTESARPSVIHNLKRAAKDNNISQPISKTGPVHQATLNSQKYFQFKPFLIIKRVDEGMYILLYVS